MLIFDCDGVLLDSEVIANRILLEHLLSLLNPHENNSFLSGPDSLREWLTYFHGKTDGEILKNFSKLTRIKVRRDFINHFESSLLKTLSHEVKPIEGMKELLESLEDKWVVASNSNLSRLRISLDKANMFDLCRCRLFSAEMVKKAKPAPDLHLHIAEKFVVSPKDCVVIEDSPAGIEAGLHAGMRVVGFTGGSHITPRHIELLKQAGARVIARNSKELFRALSF